MKPKIAATLLLLTILTAGQAHAVGDKIFTSSGQIVSGEEWDLVDIYNDDTVVDMLGGSVHYVQTFNSSTLNVTDGEVLTIEAQNTSLVNISGGWVRSPHAWDRSTINFLAGATGRTLGAGDLSTVNVSGGTLEYIAAGEGGILNLMGGVVTESLHAWGSATVNVFGYDLVKTSTGGTYGYGQVYGFWPDHAPFGIMFSTSETYSHITLVPEPSSLLVFGFGAMLLSVHRKKQYALHKRKNSNHFTEGSN